jgi:hypothetical protein
MNIIFSILFNRLIRRGGAPSGAAGFIATGGMGVSTPIIIAENYNFPVNTGALTFPMAIVTKKLTKNIKNGDRGVHPLRCLPLMGREGVTLITLRR